MARPARLAIAGVALHVIQRGNNKQACFREDSDYLVYLHHLRESSVKTGCSLHAYCLMTNHVHLLVTPPSASACGALMRNLGRAYVRYFNDRYGRTGTLWEGRFRSCLVESASYVLACYRYIELNPVRARMVDAARDYWWSSHAANIGSRTDPSVVPHAEYLAISADDERRYAEYRRFTQDSDSPSFLKHIRSATGAGHGLVGEQLKAQVIAMGRSLQRERPGPRPGQERRLKNCDPDPD
jgi:putative transposase